MNLLEIYYKWAEESIIDEVIIIAVTIAIIEAFAQNLIKNSMGTTHSKFFFGVSFYIIVGFLLHHAYHKFEMSKVNILWSCLSIISATALGYLVYNEHMTYKNLLSVIFAILAIIFSSI